jgi:hypothetical protein
LLRRRDATAMAGDVDRDLMALSKAKIATFYRHTCVRQGLAQGFGIAHDLRRIGAPMLLHLPDCHQQGR